MKNPGILSCCDLWGKSAEISVRLDRNHKIIKYTLKTLVFYFDEDYSTLPCTKFIYTVQMPNTINYADKIARKILYKQA
jgi:hypothetical protein